MFLDKAFKPLMLFSLILMLFSPEAQAFAEPETTQPQATVSHEAELVRRIDATKPRSYAQIQELFSENPSYRLECVRDTANGTNSSSAQKEGQRLFHERLIADPRFLLNFEFVPQGLGFDILARQERGPVPHHNSDAATPQYEIYTDAAIDASKLGCVEGTEKFVHHCASLTLTRERKFAMNSEDHAPDGKFLQTLTIYPNRKEEMYARLRYELSAQELSWTGRASGTITFSETYVCRLLPVPAP